MAKLHIALQEGFDHEAVVIRVNRKDVFNKQDVRTRLQIGLADSFDVEVEDGPATVEILLPKKNLTKEIKTQVPQEPYLGVSLVAGKIEHRASGTPFGYV
jgi:hypothetical protein